MTLAAFIGPCPVCHRDNDLTHAAFEYNQSLQITVAEQANRIIKLEEVIREMALQSISDFGQHQELSEECATLKSRITELETRLEISPDHNIDGIHARDCTIQMQDEFIIELKAKINQK